MANSRDYIAHVLEMMQTAGRASARAMFGGHGLYLDGMIVAIVVDDIVYLKTDDQTRPAFVARELEAFQYTTRTGERQLTSYYRPPDEALESPDSMREWVRLALAAALRAANRKSARARTRQPRST